MNHKLLLGCIIAGTIAGTMLYGCKKKIEYELPQVNSFAHIPMGIATGMAVTSGDYDDDGDVDVVCAAKLPNLREGAVYLLCNDAGKLSEPKRFATIPMGIESGLSLASVDVDDDDYLDIIVAAKMPEVLEGRLYLFTNDGKGNFSQ
ncbi:MAG: FG-GAP-like repeat-containing protein [archaeon]